MSTDDRPRPGWVRFPLWGLPGRTAAKASMWLAALCGAVCLLAGFWDVRLFAGGALFGAAFWYWAAIEWVDRYDQW